MRRRADHFTKLSHPAQRRWSSLHGKGAIGGKRQVEFPFPPEAATDCWPDISGSTSMGLRTPPPTFNQRIEETVNQRRFAYWPPTPHARRCY